MKLLIAQKAGIIGEVKDCVCFMQLILTVSVVPTQHSNTPLRPVLHSEQPLVT